MGEDNNNQEQQGIVEKQVKKTETVVKNKTKRTLLIAIISNIIPILLGAFFICIIMAVVQLITSLMPDIFSVSTQAAEQANDMTSFVKIVETENGKYAFEINEDLKKSKYDEFNKKLQEENKNLKLKDFGIDEKLFETMIQANLTTALPKIGEDGLQGAITFKRYSYDYQEAEDEEKREKQEENAKMQYVDPDTFLKYYKEAQDVASGLNGSWAGKYNNAAENTADIEGSHLELAQKKFDTEGDIESKLKKYYPYYTLGTIEQDENGNDIIKEDLSKILIIKYDKTVTIKGSAVNGSVTTTHTSKDGTYTTEKKYDESSYTRDVTYTVATEPIDYRNLVSQYNMPWEFLFSLAQISSSPDWVTEVANLAIKDSYIEIAVNDNYSENTSRDITKWTEIIETENSYGIKDHIGTEEITSGTHSWTPNMKKVYTWLYNKDVNYKKVENNPDASISTEEMEETEKIQDKVREDYSKEHSYNFEQTVEQNNPKDTRQPLTDDIKVNENGEWIDYHPFLRLWKNKLGKVEIETKKDENGNQVPINDKFERNGIKVKYKVIDVGKICTDEAIIDGCENDGVLLKILGENANTQNYETIMRYLLNKYQNTTKYGDIDVNEIIDFFKARNNIINNGAISYSSINISDEDFEILCKITSAERGNGTQQQQEYVVSSILNRVLSPYFPNTVKDVVFATNQYQPIRNGAYDKAVPSDITKAAVKNVIENGDTSQGAVYFAAPTQNGSGSSSWWNTLIFLFNDSNGEALSHNFYTDEKNQKALEQYRTYSLDAGTATETAQKIVAWAKAQVGKSQFYCRARGVTRVSTNWCASFVASAYYEAGLEYIGTDAEGIPHSNKITYIKHKTCIFAGISD